MEAINHLGAMNRAPDGAPAFRIIAWGAVYASVCSGLSPDHTEARLNAELPTGIASRWHQAPDPTFATGEPNPFPCPEEAGCTHYLFVC